MFSIRQLSASAGQLDEHLPDDPPFEIGHQQDSPAALGFCQGMLLKTTIVLVTPFPLHLGEVFLIRLPNQKPFTIDHDVPPQPGACSAFPSRPPHS